MLVPIILILILAYALGWLPQRDTKNLFKSYRDTATDALEILRQRYARGEIDREQFERMRDDLAT